MNKKEFRAIRHTLNFSAQEMAEALGLSSGRSIRHYECEQGREIPGPIVKLMYIYDYHPSFAKDWKHE